MKELAKYVVIVAGGKGLRMGVETPKQFMLLDGLPVVMQTVNQFIKALPEIKVILVLPADQLESWKKLCLKYNFTAEVELTTGGETRFHSVKNGVAKITGEGLIGIHDAVRPLVSAATIQRTYAAAEQLGNASPVIAINDSIREVDSQGNKMVNREKYKIVQTPQVFQADLIKKGFQQEFRESFTDDTSVIETLGEKVNLVEGNFENIKLTRPIDFLLAETFIRSQNL